MILHHFRFSLCDNEFSILAFHLNQTTNIKTSFFQPISFQDDPEVKVVVSDPPKGMNDDISGADVYFLQIHVPTEADGSQDLTLMKKLISALPDRPVFVRTTILPGTSERLSRETGHRVYFMPEFLTERTYIEDFRRQPMVFTGEEVPVVTRVSQPYEQ